MFKTNKMGRKIVAGLTITAMLASLAGCSGSTGSSGDTSTEVRIRQAEIFLY